MATARETQLAERVTELEQANAALENTVAQLIRATYAMAGMIGSGGGWTAWLRIGAPHQALDDLHAHLQRHPAPGQD